jgi:hypothetical protein
LHTSFQANQDEASFKGGFMVKGPTRFIQALAVAVALLSTKDVFAAQQLTIPEGTVIELRMETELNSESSRVDDALRRVSSGRFSIDGRVALPEKVMSMGA